MSRRRNGISPVWSGGIAVLLIVIGVYFAFTKANPFAKPYELNAVFESANQLRENSPVRTAGIDIGKVTEVKPMGDGSGLAKVTMEIDEAGLPIKRDAELKIRTRLFLEGNYFVDLQPGTPSAPKLASGGTIPPSQTAFPVQFGQVLQVLQSETREDLQSIFRELATAYSGEGAEGFSQWLRYTQPAYRSTALVNHALLGRERHDLSRLLDGQAKVFGALSRDEDALANLVTDLNTTVAALASEDENLRLTIPALRDVFRVGRPALASLDRALPSARAFARDALPGARSSVATLDAQIPFVRQLRGLVSEREGRGLVRDLRPTIPALAQLNRSQTKSFAQTRALARCQNRVILPFSREPMNDPAFPNHTGESYSEEGPRAFVGLAGESRLADANSAYFRVLAGTGPTTIFSTGETGERLFGQMPEAFAGTRPPRPPQAPVFRPNIPCENQEPPDMNAPQGPGDASREGGGGGGGFPELPLAKREKALEEIKLIQTHLKAQERGEPTIDPLAFSEEGRKLQAKRLGLEMLPDGRYRKKKAGR